MNRNMKRLVASLALAFVMIDTANAAGAGTLESGTLAIGADLNYAPYDYFDGSTPAGLDPTLISLLAQQMKVAPRFIDTRFANLILGLKANRFDMASAGMYVTPERAKQVDFLPYMMAGVSIIIPKGAAVIPTKPEDLCGMRVSSIQGAAWIPKLVDVSKTFCRANGKADIRVVEFPTSAEAAQALLAGAAEAQMEDAAVSAGETQKNDRLRISSTELLYPVVVGYAVRKGNTDLLTALQRSLQALKSNGQYARLLQKYNVKEPSSEQVKAALGD